MKPVILPSTNTNQLFRFDGEFWTFKTYVHHMFITSCEDPIPQYSIKYRNNDYGFFYEMGRCIRVLYESDLLNSRCIPIMDLILKANFTNQQDRSWLIHRFFLEGVSLPEKEGVVFEGTQGMCNHSRYSGYYGSVATLRKDIKKLQELGLITFERGNPLASSKRDYFYGLNYIAIDKLLQTITLYPGSCY